MVLKYVDALGVPDHKLLATVTDIARNYSYQLKKEEKVNFSTPSEGNRPFIHIPAETLGEAWERAVISVLAFGSDVHTYYDQPNGSGGFKHVGSREAKAVLEIFNPYDPRIHLNFPGGIESLIDYAAEVIDGNKDHRMLSFENIVKAIKEKKFEEIRGYKKWKYTYHQRLTAYPMITPEGEIIRINQFDQMLNKLKREPLSKSVQAITWMPWMDHNDITSFEDYDSPCFQRFWYRLTPFSGERGKGYKSNLDTDWRSRCLYKAVPMNCFAFMMWKKIMDEKAERALEVPIYEGTSFDHSNSLHLYGYYIDPLHPDKGEDGRKFLDDVLRMINEPIEARFLIPGTDKYDSFMDAVPGALKRLREDMASRGHDISKLDYLGRSAPLFGYFLSEGQFSN